MAPLTDAERAARYRAKRAAGTPSVQYRKPADRRSRPKRWADAVQTLAEILDEMDTWQERLPESLAESGTAERLAEMLELRELVEQLANARLPRGFGRDQD